MSNPLSPDPNQNLLPSTSFSALNWSPSQEPNPVVVLQSDLLIGHINQNLNIPAVTPNPSDSLLLAQIEGSIATIDPNITLPNDNSFDGLTGEAIDIVKEQLTQFAKVPNFVEKMNLAFGESADTQAANVLNQDWLNGDFSSIPPVKFVSSAEIGGANGAFASATDTIYLSRELLAGNGTNPAAVADVLLEEIGHSVDSRLNITDAPGDEGAVFAAVVQGKDLSKDEIQGLQSEDDHDSVVIDGHKYLVEKQSSFPIQGSIGSFYYSHPTIAQVLGQPTAAEFQFSSGKWRQNFQGGAILHSAKGTFSVHGSLGNYYLKLGGQNSQLGLPTSEESSIGNGNWKQSFENGVIYWLNNGTAQVQLNGDSASRLTSLSQKSSPLTIDEIREYRQLVSQRPEAERAGFYKTLQLKVPYFNQNDNASTWNGQRIGNIMCNVTTLASCLTYLGVKNPNPSKQFEDSLEDILRANPSTYPSMNGINARHWWSNLSKLATNLGVASSGTQYMPGFPSTDITTFKNFVKNNWEPALKQGKAIMTGVATTSGGHILKVLDIDWNRGGIIVDDPYGRAQNISGDNYKKNYNYTNPSNTINPITRGAVNTQNGQNENGNGNDNFWDWNYCAEVFGDTYYLRLG